MNAGERPAEDRRNALYMRAQQNSAAARLTVHLGVAAGLLTPSSLITSSGNSFSCSFHYSFTLGFDSGKCHFAMSVYSLHTKSLSVFQRFDVTNWENKQPLLCQPSTFPKSSKTYLVLLLLSIVGLPIRI